MNKGIVIAGPTGVGKTSLSIKLAKKIDADIISSDSMQVYKYMDIGTAKITKNEMEGVKHYLIDEIEPTHKYSVGEYYNRVNEVLSNLNGKNVILAGGTGLYIRSITEGLSSLPESNLEIRKELLKYTLEELCEKLKKIDIEAYKAIDLKNRIRVERALEVCLITNEKYSKLRNKNIKNNNYTFIKIGLKRDREILYNRINKRVDIMFNEGLLNEAKFLYENYKKGIENIKAIGYKELFLYFEGKITLNEAKEIIKRETRRYAKRQFTWFNKEKDIIWFDLDKQAEEEIIENILEIFNV
ncbi:tRNA dimethylallyltransferase [Hypnocyclicus thermotrophus]|uniref:tRNA dimethylallyltransferase n=1 Tax=Hypnocyclicus thermotrophus TaxID=1627895 RepID=A0AA46DY32_9FUSO|nr:tRNA (adenosine(37)-N6)-dimethylallyltransferase MiaA [Hypnocyclicus thermotrophus]TDT69172.1 tRNA dimethylallyltransferase [Hypnocyclicus thermotrophus]